MSYLDAAKRGIRAEVERKKKETILQAKTEENKLLQENLDFERSNPELLQKFLKFAAEYHYPIERAWDTQELYADSGTLIYTFRGWIFFCDKLVILNKY